MKVYVCMMALTLIAGACNSAISPTSNSTATGNSNSSSEAGRQAATATPTPGPSPQKSEAAHTKTVPVRFPTGATEASYTDRFSGYGVVDYKFDARAGQQLTAEITRSDSDKAVLSVIRNGEVIEGDASMVQGWAGILPSNGAYVVRIGQMRNTARGSEAPVKFSLRIEIVD